MPVERPWLRYATLLLASCATPGNAASQLAQPPAFEPAGQGKCGVEKSQNRPLVVEWASADRLELETKAREGLVAVHYQGCEMRVLPRCKVDARYKYLGGTRKQDRVDIRNADDLYAHLPVGAARLEGTLSRSGRLTVDMNLVGRFEAERPGVRVDELHGECDGATHFVYGIAVGAFDFYAGTKAEVGAGVEVLGAGAGGGSSAGRDTLTKDGDPDACGKATSGDATPPEGCGALIRLEVVALGAADPDAGAAPVYPKTDAVSTVKSGAMVQVPAGKFTMGSNDGAPNERPAHDVKVAAFDLDATEVTVADYAACTRTGACTAAGSSVDWPGITDAYRRVYDQFCNVDAPDRSDHPVNCVDWTQASAYCKWASKRLPTEEEWEYAARGTDGRRFPWGNDPAGPKLLDACGDECVAAAKLFGQTWTPLYAGNDGAPFTAPVGAYPAGRSPFGAYDMLGNVWEWTASGWSDDYKKARTDDARAYRGGGWASFDASQVTATHRARMPPTARGHALGFRCAR